VGLACVLLAAAPARPAAAEAGERIFASRGLAPDPAWHASAGAFGATGSGLGASLGNPATLARTPLPSAAASHLTWAEGITREWLAAGWAVSNRAAMALDAGFLRAPALPGFDADGNAAGEFQPSEWHGGVSFAFAASPAIALGLGARYFRLEDPAAPVGAPALSGGLLWHGATRAAGLALTDAGMRVRGETGRWDLPTAWTAGVEQTVAGGWWTLAAAASGTPSGLERLRAAVSARPSHWCELLGGYDLASGAGSSEGGVWSAGAVLASRGMQASYAVQSSETLGLTHQFGLGFAPRSR